MPRFFNRLVKKADTYLQKGLNPQTWTNPLGTTYIVNKQNSENNGLKRFKVRKNKGTNTNRLVPKNKKIYTRRNNIRRGIVYAKPIQ